MNIINAAFVRNGATVRTLPVYQYNRGMILQISGLDDLPSTFRADFANTETGQSKSVIGTDNAVHVPYEYFVPGATIHCWLVWSGEDYAVTRKHIMIPVARRATPTDDEPSPEEQGVIDQAIAALNDAVTQTGQDAEAAAGYAEQAEQSAQTATDAKDNAVAAQNAAETAKDQASQSSTSAAASAQSASESAQSASQSKTAAQEAAASVADAMDTLEATIQADLQAAKESGEFDGADGVSPTVTVTPTIDGHQVMITDAEGEHTFDVTDGKNGLNGDPGADGFSPLATVTQTQTGAVITVTDKTGTTTATVTNGAKGDPGTPGADGFSPVATVTQTQTGATISITDKTGTTTAQISNGAKGDPGDDYVLTAQDKAEIAQQAAAEVDVPTVATTSQVKAGTDSEHFLAPSVQDNAVFYAIAKAAGVDMASSSNPVGTYTDEAKIAIRKMLGIYEAPWELIREDTFTNETEADHEITVDGNGQAFELTDALLVLIVPTHSEDTTIGDYGRIYLYYNNTEIRRIYLLNTASKLVQANSTPQIAIGRLLNNNGLMSVDFFPWTAQSNRASLQIVPNSDSNGTVTPFAINTNYVDNIKIGKITGQLQYRLFGRRKWQ